MFHVDEGLTFDRLENGDVHVVQRENKKIDGLIIFQQIIPADAWASVIASMSKGGEEDSRFYAAQAFHASEGEIEIKKKTTEITVGFGRPIVRPANDENDHQQD